MNTRTLTAVSIFLLLVSSTAFTAQITLENASKLQKMVQLTGHTGPVFTLAFSPNGKMLVSGGSASDHDVRIWDLSSGASGNPRAHLTGHTAQIAAVAFSSDNTKALSASYDKTLRIWDAATGKLLTVIGQGQEAGLLSIDNLVTTFSRDGNKLAYSNDAGQGPFLFDVNTRKQTDLKNAIAGSKGNPGPIAVSGDASLLAVGAGEQGAIYLIDTKTGKQTGMLQPPDSPGGGVMALSRDGSKLAVSNDATSKILIFDVTAKKAAATLAGHKENTSGMLSITGLAFSPDNKLLVSTSYDRTIHVWDVASGKSLATMDVLTAKGPCGAAWAPDQSMIATADLDGSITVWSVR